jgi:amino acid adenylation domain-containing protein
MERALNELSREEKLALVRRLAEEPREYPASFVQRRLWFLDRLEPGAAHNTVFRAFRLTGDLDREALGRAVAALVRRHEALRTRFSEAGGEPGQVVAPPGAVGAPLARRTLAEVAPDRRQAALAELARAEAAAPFDLGRGPLVRFMLVDLAPREAALLVAVHHAVADGWSLGILFRELSELYAGRRAGGEPALPPLPARFGDHARRQRQELSGAGLERELAFWRSYLDGAPRVLDLPADRPRPALESFRGAIEPFRLDPETTGAAKALAREERATPFMVLLAAWAVVLSRWSGQEDLLVGTAVAGRPDPELEGVIGCFANTLVLRADLRGLADGRGLVRRLRQGCLGAFSHQEMPFEHLVEALEPDRDLSRNPLYQVMIALQNQPAGAFALPGVEVRPFPVERGLAKVDLTLDLVERDGGLAGYLEYNTDLFDRTTAARMVRHLERAARALAAHPDRPLAELGVAGREERHLLLAEWNDTAAPAPPAAAVHGLAAAAADTAPDRIAVEAGGRAWSHGRLRAETVRLVGRLRRIGVEPEVRVALCLRRSPEALASFLAVLEAGGAYVPLDPEYPDERLAFILRDSGARVALADGELAARLRALAPAGVEVVEIAAGVAVEGDGPGADPADVPGERAAYVIYTSGTTGRPKGVVIPHRALANHALAVAEAYGVAPGERVLQFASLSFDIAGEEIYPALARGATLVLRTEELSLAPAELVRFLAERRLAAVNVPTPLWHEWVAELEAGRAAPPAGLRLVVVGTEGALPERLAAWTRALEAGPASSSAAPGRPRWINAYGPTEATITATLFAPGAGEAGALHRVPIGRPLANVRAHVADAALAPAPPGVQGELLLGGAGLARGYLDRPAATAEVFVPDPFAAPGRPGARLYRTGDRARFRPDGAIEFLGRTDDQVKIRGFRVEPGEVAAALAEHAGVREAAVVAREAGPGDRRLVAYLVEDPARPVDDESLRRHLAERLPAYMVPAAFVRLPELPLTPAGKVDRRALPEPERYGAERGQTPPRGPVESLLADLFAEVLGAASVGVHDDFFRLGGHSLLATRVIARLRDRLGVELPLRALFEAPTVAGLAARVSAARAGGALPPLKPVPRPGAGPWELPLSFAQQRLWILDRLEPGKPIYNVPAAVRLETGDAELDLAALELALAEIVARHEALRTTFVRRGGEPVQRIERQVPVRLGLHDLRAAGERAARLALDEARAPFDLELGPLFRFTLLRLPEEERLLVTFHHIVADGWSIDLFLRELAALYDAFAAGRPSPLAPLPVQYGDHAAWLRQALAGEDLERLLGFWRGALAGAPQVLDLPADRPRPPAPSYRGGRRYLRLAPAASEALAELGRGAGASPFMVTLAAFLVLLSRLSGARDLLVGTPVAGRGRSEVEELIGFFVNTLVVRGDLAGDPGFRELLARVREAALDAFVYGDLPFERLVEELEPERDLAYNPLFQVMFSFQSSGLAPEPAAVGAGGLRPVLRSSYNDTARVDLALTLWPDRGGLAGFVEYAADLFDPATAARLAGWYEALVEALLAAPERPVRDLPFLSRGERQQLLVEWSDTARAVPAGASLHGLFEARARATPEAPAVTAADGELSYRELDQRSALLAARLRRAGVGAETLVGVCVERSTRLPVALLGVLRAGGAYVPLDPAFPAERLALMVEDAGLGAVVTEEALVGRLPEAARSRTLIRLDADWPEIAAAALDGPAEPAEPIAPERLAYVLFTSGSTGRPKGVQVSHGAAVNFLLAMAERPGLAAGESLLAVTTLSFDIALLELFLPLAVSGRVVIAPAEAVRDGAALAALIAAVKPAALQATPATWRLLAELGERPGDGWSGPPPAKALCGGEALAPELAAHLLAQGVELWNLYGPTETTVWSGALRLDRAAGAGGAVPVGGPIANTRLTVLDPGGRPTGVGVPGELAIGGAGLARGYLGRPGPTAERFRPDPWAPVPGARLYRTGDLVRWRGDGRLDFLGRLDHQVKVRGFRIELGEIEAALGRLPGVGQAAVAARGEAADRRLVAYAVPAAGAGGASWSAALRAGLRASLPEYMVPAVFVELPELPLTPNGKLDRRRLPEPGAERSDLAAGYVAPRTPVERTLAAVWAEVLRVARVGIADDFFALGGHSLKATQVMTRIEQAFGLELPLRALFESPTVAGLAERLVAHELESAGAAALAEALDEIENLSQDELEAFLAAGDPVEGEE